MLESMASGVPVVAVAAGGIPNIINRPGANGMLYQPGDLKGCAAHINTLVANKQLYASVQAAALEVHTVLAAFSLGAHVGT